MNTSTQRKQESFLLHSLHFAPRTSHFALSRQVYSESLMHQAFQLIVFLPSVADALAKRGVSPSRPLEVDN